MEHDLLDARPRAPHELLDRLEARAGTRRRSYRSTGARLAVLGIAVVSLAAVGGIGFAASTALNSTKVKVQKVAAGSAKSISVKQALAVRNAAADQYGQTAGVNGASVPKKDLKVTAPATGSTADTSPGLISISSHCTVPSSGTLYLSAIAVKGASSYAIKLDPLNTTVDGDPVGGGYVYTLQYTVEKPRTLDIQFGIFVGNAAGARRGPGETYRPQCRFEPVNINVKDLSPAQRAQLKVILPPVAPTAWPSSVKTPPKPTLVNVRLPKACRDQIDSTVESHDRARVTIARASQNITRLIWNLNSGTGPFSASTTSLEARNIDYDVTVLFGPKATESDRATPFTCVVTR